ncbi:MAG: phosphatase [Lachnospiraceae bacterium]|nr:phosphatase [Lachnospiraceae bacterium]MDD3614861.1 phosphatase [Lachnospiraceae bacterium]
MLALDLHTHTIASGHGTTDTILDLAASASKKGLSILGITDHGPGTRASGTSSYFRSLYMAPKKRFGVHMMYGVELNILDTRGTFDLDEWTLSLLDYAIASMHPQNFTSHGIEGNTKAYLCAMKNPHVRIIGHCDDIKYPVDYQALVRGAMENHVFLELNNASLNPEGYRGDTRANNEEILKYCRQYQYPVLLSSDSHGAHDVGSTTYIDEFLSHTDFPEELILNRSISRFKHYWY